jgi:N-acetylneuraminate synthase/N,N'-diacetyllegionaminate synthase
MKKIKIGNKNIGIGSPVFFIAEAGVNHNGSLKIALKMIDVAKEAGADAIKFQTFKTSNLILPNAPKSKYHIETTGDDTKQTWFDLLKTQELSYQMHKKIIEHCKKRKIIFLSTPYDEESVDMLEKFKIMAYKVASTDNTNLPLLHYIAKKGKPMLISTAMSNITEVQDAVKCVKRYIPNKFVLMQCTGNYPSKNSDSNLSVMLTYKKSFGCLYGYSDHTLDFINPVAATALGASVYEKHFTLDRKLDGPDHRMSLLPSELKKTIEIIKNTKIALGNKKKQILDSEKHNRLRLKKSLVTKIFIKKGEKLNKNKLAIKRPGTGLPPKEIFNVMNYVALRDIKANSVLKKKMLKRIK